MVLATGRAFASPITLPEFEATNFSGLTWEGGIVPFDHTLGTLTSVSVTITGTLSATVQTFPSFTPPPVVIPIPTPSPFL
jgi:hypothetical protein